MTFPSQPLLPPHRSRRRGRWFLYVLTGLLSLSAVLETVLRPPTPITSQAVGAPTELGPVTIADPSDPLDGPLRLLKEAREAYARVHDYTCLFVKKEQLGGKVGPDQVMTMQFRTDPFSVHLKWQEPRNLVGQEACYVEGKNNGKMRGKSAGALGAIGFITVETDDERAQKASRHSIKEAGIGNLVNRFSKCWEEERHLPGTQVRMADYEYNKRLCTRVEVTEPVKKPPYTAYRVVIYFDKEQHLPIRLEVYDWPHAVGGEPEVLEIYSYANLVLNAGLDDKTFNK
jgi:hypothetical protein